MQDAMHAARLVAAQSALLALLIEQQGDRIENVDGITVSVSLNEEGTDLGILYTSNGMPVGGEGV